MSELQKNRDYLLLKWEREVSGEVKRDNFLVCLNRSKVKALAKAFPDWVIYMAYEIHDLAKVAHKPGLIEAVHRVKKMWLYSVVMGMEFKERENE